MIHFVNSIADGIPMTPTGKDGLRAQMMADAADQSARDGRLVKLDLA